MAWNKEIIEIEEKKHSDSSSNDLFDMREKTLRYVEELNGVEPLLEHDCRAVTVETPAGESYIVIVGNYYQINPLAEDNRTRWSYKLLFKSPSLQKTNTLVDKVYGFLEDLAGNKPLTVRRIKSE